MIHRYKRHCFRVADGRSFVEELELTGDDVALTLGGRWNGRRESFLELLNRWNRAGVGQAIGANGMIYIYTAEVTSA